MAQDLVALVAADDVTNAHPLEVEILLGYLRQFGYFVTAAVLEGRSGGDTKQETLIQDLAAGQPRWIYWHMPSRREYQALSRWASRIREFGFEGRLLAGDYFATGYDLEILRQIPDLDAIVRGELEPTVAEILRAGDHWARCSGITLQTPVGPRRNPPRETLLDLKRLPPAADDLFHPQRRRTGQRILFNRGCAGNCRYCGLQTWYRQDFVGRTSFWRTRSPTAIVDEMEWYLRHHGVRKFRCSAHVFFGYSDAGTAVIREVTDEILRRGLELHFQFITHPAPLVRNEALIPRLRKAGLSHIYLGIDSGVEAALERYRVDFDRDSILAALRILHRHRIPFTAGFFLYDPEGDLQEFRRQLSFLRRIAPFFDHLPRPFPFYLERDLLLPRLIVNSQMPRMKALAAKGLAEIGDPLSHETRVSFREPLLATVLRLHRSLAQGLWRSWRSELWDRRTLERSPALRFLLLDSLERLLDVIRVAEEREDDVIVRDLARWAQGRLRSGAWHRSPDPL